MDNQWDKKVTDFLKRTGDELKRAGEDLRAEAQRLVEEVKDPGNQQKLRETLSNLGAWAKKTAEEAGGIVESAVNKAQDALSRATTRSEAQAPSANAPAVEEPMPSEPATAPSVGQPVAKPKTIGGKKPGKTAAKAAKKSAKTIGKKKK